MGGNHVYVKYTQDTAQPLVLHGLFHRNLPFLIESKPAFHTESNVFSNSAFLTSSKPAFHTKSSASKPNAFTKSVLSTSLTALSTSLTALSTSLTALSTSLTALFTSLLTYSHWHKVFCHMDTFTQNKSFFKDGEILSNFIKYNCQPYLLLKSVHYLPNPSLTRATKSLECIFSDLSEKAPILSLGGRFYYITLIDYFTCFAWIYFLKETL